jgi:hypothetical protein
LEGDKGNENSDREIDFWKLERLEYAETIFLGFSIFLECELFLKLFDSWSENEGESLLFRAVPHQKRRREK